MAIDEKREELPGKIFDLSSVINSTRDEIDTLARLGPQIVKDAREVYRIARSLERIPMMRREDVYKAAPGAYRIRVLAESMHARAEKLRTIMDSIVRETETLSKIAEETGNLIAKTV